MGYFSNGSEGMDYRDRFCVKCIHNQQESYCPCWDAHLSWNYAECNNEDSVLHKMIPIDEKHNNQQCIFFVEATDLDRQVHTKAQLDQWNKDVEKFNTEQLREKKELKDE